jgi:hypothetical protein
MCCRSKYVGIGVNTRMSTFTTLQQTSAQVTRQMRDQIRLEQSQIGHVQTQLHQQRQKIIVKEFRLNENSTQQVGGRRGNR